MSWACWIIEWNWEEEKNKRSWNEIGLKQKKIHNVRWSYWGEFENERKWIHKFELSKVENEWVEKVIESVDKNL